MHDAITAACRRYPLTGLSKGWYHEKIGCFRRNGDVYIGEIAIMHVRLHVRIAPVTYEYLPGFADFIMTYERRDHFAADLGKVWRKYTREEGSPFIAVEINDPLCQHPIQAVLCEGIDGLYYLYWDRYATGDHIAETLYAQEELNPQIGIVRPPQTISEKFREMFPSLTE